MDTFLDRSAKAILDEHGHFLEKVAVVLPSQRAGLYLCDALARHAGNSLWSPELLTLPTLMERVSGLGTLPTEELLFEAYEAYRVAAGSAARPLEEFMDVAPTMVADMSEADAHLVGLEGFYRDLRSWEELDWSFNVEPLSEGQERMVRYWAMAGRMHHLLNERLLARGKGTSGLVSRTAAAKAEQPLPWERIWFVGLNALTAAEQRVVDCVRDGGRAEFIWDADSYYLEDRDQEAGEHLRKAIARYGAGRLPVRSELAQHPPRVEVVRAPNSVAQAWCAADILRERSPEDRARTAIILADEGLLPAVIEALPADGGPVNITMGPSLAALPVGSLLDAFVQLHASSRSDDRWPIAAIEALLRHPYLRHGRDGQALEDVLMALLSTRSRHVPAARIKEVLTSLPEEVRMYAAVVLDGTTGPSIHERAMALLSWARLTMAGDGFATEQIYQASIILGNTLRSLEKYGHALSGTAWNVVMKRLMRAARIGLFGEPLSGLQVMGLLESRGLDPRHIILLGAQEGNMPNAANERSYIPFELRKAHGLPLRDSTDAVQAYNFMRLIQRAKDVVLVHADDGTANGPSRYISQLRTELYTDRPDLMTYTDARVVVPERKVEGLVVPKDEATLAELRSLLEHGVSPTMLRTWARCPLDLWFRYLRRLQEPDIPGARIGGDVLGNALHAVLESIHRPWCGSPLDADAVLAEIPGSGDALRARLAEVVPKDFLTGGEPLLQTGMAVRAAENFLQGEARALKRGSRIVPLVMEQEYSAELIAPGLPAGLRPLIKGRIDRVDERDGVIHILDLKTGRVDDKAMRIKAIDQDLIQGDKGYTVQLLVYAWLYLQVHPDVASVRTGLQPLQRSQGSEGLFLRIGDTDLVTRDHLPAITELLAGVVRSILDPAVPIAHEPTSRYCPFCVSVD